MDGTASVDFKSHALQAARIVGAKVRGTGGPTHGIKSAKDSGLHVLARLRRGRLEGHEATLGQLAKQSTGTVEEAKDSLTGTKLLGGDVCGEGAA